MSSISLHSFFFVSLPLSDLNDGDEVKVLPEYSALVLLPLFDYLLLEAGEEAPEGAGGGVSQGDRWGDSSWSPRSLSFSGRYLRRYLLLRRGRLDPVQLSLFFMLLVLVVEDDLTGRPDAVVITHSFFIPQPLELPWNPGLVHLLLQVLVEACLHLC